MKKIITAILLCFMFLPTLNVFGQFSLTGKTKNIKDGTVIYLTDMLTNTPLDSAEIKNNIFIFNTTLLLEVPMNVVLHTKDFSRLRSLWVENNAMTFDATSSDFRNASVTGSKTDSLDFEQTKKIIEIGKANDMDALVKAEVAFIKNNPNCIVSMSKLSFIAPKLSTDSALSLYNAINTEYRNTPYGERAKSYFALNKNTQLGSPFIDFEMKTPNGKSKKLSEYKGKLVLLEFWASWCGPCRKTNPELVKTYNKFNPNGFEIFAVSLDADMEAWKKAIEKDNLTWQHVSDLKGGNSEIMLIYGLSGIPDNFLINENGIIIGRNLKGEELDKAIEKALANK